MTKARFSLFLTLISVVFISTGLILFPNESSSAARDALILCGNILIPSLFPFFVLSNLVIESGLASRIGKIFARFMKPLFRVNGAGSAALILGLIGGYPIGASCAVELYQKKLCSKAETERLLGFCNNSGPAFILGAVGAGIFGSMRIGLLLYTVHVLSAFICGILFRFYRFRDFSVTSSVHITPAKPFSSTFPKSIRSALKSTLNVCAFVVFFGVLMQILRIFKIIPNMPTLFSHALSGCFEITTGLSLLTPTPGTLSSCFVLAAFLLGISGLSILAQTLSLLSDTDLSSLPCILGKILHGILSALLALFITQTPLFPKSQAVFAISLLHFPRFAHWILAWFLLFLVIPIKKYWKKRR